VEAGPCGQILFFRIKNAKTEALERELPARCVNNFSISDRTPESREKRRYPPRRSYEATDWTVDLQAPALRDEVT
jgi:hypothetical protein